MRKTAFFSITLCIILLSSCVNGLVSDIEQQSKNTITFTLFNSAASAGATKATRSVDNMLNNEKVINRIDIFFFKSDGATLLFYPDNSQIVINSDKVTVNVPESIMESIDATNGYSIYVLANCQLDRSVFNGKTLIEIKQLLMSNVAGKMFNESDAPVDFMMDSELLNVSFNNNSSPAELGKIYLYRAAAKVVLDIIRADISGYTAVKAEVKIVNFLNKTTLGSEYLYAAQKEDFKSATKTLTAQNDNNHSFLSDASNPIYTYANDWATNKENESYLLLAVDWQKNGEDTPKTYYYRIPFSYINATEGDIEANKNRIRRNFIYQFAVEVTRFGALDPAEAMDIAANFELIDWTSKTVNVSILQYHFLFVYNPNVEIHNRNTNIWEYKSSKEPITITLNEVFCNEYAPSGSISKRVHTPSDPQYPIITLPEQGGRSYFTFASLVPVNYVPLYITATVTNGTGLSSNISLIIYPKIYVTASYSYGGRAGQGDGGIIPTGSASVQRDGKTIWLAGSYNTANGMNGDVLTNNPNGQTGQNGEADQKNFNFFTVHITSLDTDDEAHGIRIGNPTELIPHPGATSGLTDNDIYDPANNIPWNTNYSRTLYDAVHNNILSPQFVIATQRGITSVGKTQLAAQQRCATYRESQYAAGEWRMPTLAELKLVRRMQLDPNSAIKDLFVKSSNIGWWSAQTGHTVNLSDPNDNTAVVDNPSQRSSVRCVRDLWID
ncbi:MAG: fimbrial protein [Bacteroidales bacterium]